jgi:hypothetical protein
MQGTAISLVSPDETRLLRDIERLIGREIAQETLEDYEVTTRAQQENARNNNRHDRPRKRQAARPGRPKRPAVRKPKTKPGYGLLAERIFPE